LAVVLCLSASQASAAGSREKLARKACLAGDYATGVEILAELFVETQNPNLVFNQGRCFEQNGRYKDAILRFREYLRIATRLTDGDVAQTEKHIADCEALLGRDGTAPRQGGPAATQEGAVAEAVDASNASVSAVQAEAPASRQLSVVQRSANPPRAGRDGLKVAAIVVASFGGAALATGLGLHFKNNSMASSLEVPGSYSRTTNSRRETYATLAWVSYGVGTACVAAGDVMYLLGRAPTHEDRASLAWSPVLAPGEAGVVG
jgi:tetratricopeptide (TPR) repeat protein